MDSRQPSESVTYTSRVQSRPAAANTSSDPVRRQRQGRANLVPASLNGRSIPFSGASKPTTMSSDTQRRPQKMNARGTPSNKPKDQRQPRVGSPGAIAATSNAKASMSGVKALPQRQTRKPAARPSATSTTASPNNSRPATAPPPRQNHVVFTHKAKDEEDDILWKALQKHPVKEEKPWDQPKWFDSYDSLDRKLLVEYGKHKDYEKTRLADLEILIGKKNGTPHQVGLQHAVRDTISYLLDVEAEWNPVTDITGIPEAVSKSLRKGKGKLYLGGIKDSGSVEGVLRKLQIDAVVSIHPTDWLTDECWKDLFKKWDWRLDPSGSSLQSRQENSKPMQYHIELHDESSSDLLSYFERAFCFMDRFLVAQGRNVLVHCKMGQSRSASLVLGYMMYRYYKTSFETLDSNQRPSMEIVSAKLQGARKLFLGELTRKRKGVDTKKFDDQLDLYVQYLAEGKKGRPPKPPKLSESHAGGGIIKVAAPVLCFMCDIKQTLEIQGYEAASRSKSTHTHYWEAASRDKALKDHLAKVNEVSEDPRKVSEIERKVSPQKAPPK